MLFELVENPSVPVLTQDTAFTTDTLGRFTCSTWDEATKSGGVQFGAVVIGAGMFGAYCAEKIYRNANLRVLLLDAGSFLLPEHTQNLPALGLDSPGPAVVAGPAQDPGPQKQVWGYPWRSNVAFPGLAYCVGGRSLYWGGWSPRLTPADLANWPADVAQFLQSATGTGDAYEATERETGVLDKADFIVGPLFDALFAKANAVCGSVRNLTAIEEAPLAVQASAPGSGLFGFDKYSSVPILMEGVRTDAQNPDWRRRLFLVPRAHVTRLVTAGNTVSRIELVVNGQPKFLDIVPQCAVVIANGTIEATRLALSSFPTPLMGRNLMAHLRSNTTVRIKRSALDPNLPRQLETAALLVRGQTNQNRRFHLQVTAAAVTGGNPEVDLFQMVPDIDLVDRMLSSQDQDKVVITFRGIGEMVGSKDPGLVKSDGQFPSFVDLSPDQSDPTYSGQRAWVNLVTTQDDLDLWRAMDDAALALAQKIAGSPANIEYLYPDGSLKNSPSTWHANPPSPSTSNDRNNPNNKVRDGLGTTHHEAGSLWMGPDPNTSVTNSFGRFHHIANAYVAGPALFPALGSANPSLTGLSLARRTALEIVGQSLPRDVGFRPLGSGGLDGWQQAGTPGFIELGANIIESFGGIGLLWYSREQFANFILRVDWRLSAPDDNSGVYLRVPALTGATNDLQIADTQGYEVQIDNTGKNPDVNPNTFNDPLHVTGAIYKLAPANLPSLPAVGQWHNYEITAQGNTITVVLDRQLVSTLNNANRSPRGHIGLQNHHPNARVQFRNIRVKTL